MKNDYADWLSPMLVKELRQGVRNRAFISTFIFLQVAMLLTMMVGLLTGAEGGSADSTVIFWVLVGASVLIVLPMSGMNAVGGEIKANTLELIFLTRLSSLRIVAGKWLAILVSSALLICAVLPYLVLRYFLGGVNITVELIALFSMLSASALFTAITVGFSSYQTRIARGLIGFVVLFGVQAAFTPFFAYGRSSSVTVVGSAGVTNWQTACLLACGAILLVLMLDVGASQIAPAAENHSAIKRLLGFALLAVAGYANLAPGDAAGVTMLAFLLSALICATALCEQPRWIPSIYQPFAARGFPGRMLVQFLTPGWHTAVWYSSVIFLSFAALMMHSGLLSTLLSCLRLMAVFGTLLLPVAITRFFFPKTDKPLVIFFSVLVFCLVLAIITGIIDQTLKTSLKDLIAFLPVCALLQSADTTRPVSFSFAFGVPLVTLGSWLTLLVVSQPLLRRARALATTPPQTPVVETLQPVLPDGPLA